MRIKPTLNINFESVKCLPDKESFVSSLMTVGHSAPGDSLGDGRPDLNGTNLDKIK